MTALGRVDDAAKARRAARADLLCAPSLGGESFGMVLTEAFAAGTPVVASDIAGYRDVVARRRDGRARPAWRRHGAGRDAARPGARPRARRRAARAAARERRALRVAARRRAGRARLRGRASPCRRRRRATRACRGAASALRPADGLPRVPARRLPSLEPAPARRGARPARRGALGRRGARDRRRRRAGGRTTSDRRGSATRSCARARPGCSSAWR